MKKRLNILCVVVILVLCYSVVKTGYYFSLGFMAGLDAVSEDSAGNRMAQEAMNLKLVKLDPSSFLTSEGRLLPDSVYNEKSQTYVPAAYSELAVSLDTCPPRWSAVLHSLIPFVELCMYIWTFVLFLRLIVSINQSDIFNWRNVRRLRFMGGALVLAFGCSLLVAYIDVLAMKAVFSLKGYSFNLACMIEITTLVLGLCSLIVAEVFAIGLRMKEEQELTI